MSDEEKFEGFKQKVIAENEAKYGKEIREKYGDEVIDASNAKVKGMSPEKWKRAQELSECINETLKEAFEKADIRYIHKIWWHCWFRIAKENLI